MSKIINLSLGERVLIISIFNAFKGGNIELNKAILDAVQPIAVTPEEWVKAQLVKTPTDEQVKEITDAMTPEQKAEGKPINQQWNWKEEGMAKDVELSDKVVEYITGQIKAKSDANEITLIDAPTIISLDEKLK